MNFDPRVHLQSWCIYEHLSLLVYMAFPGETWACLFTPDLKERGSFQVEVSESWIYWGYFQEHGRLKGRWGDNSQKLPPLELVAWFRALNSLESPVPRQWLLLVYPWREVSWGLLSSRNFLKLVPFSNFLSLYIFPPGRNASIQRK